MRSRTTDRWLLGTRALVGALALGAALVTAGCTGDTPHILPDRSSLKMTTCGSGGMTASVEGAEYRRDLLGCSASLVVGPPITTLTLHPGQWIVISSDGGRPFRGGLESLRPDIVSVSSNVLRASGVGTSDIRARSGVDCNAANGATAPDRCILLEVRVTK
jgi:hypothetical protein